MPRTFLFRPRKNKKKRSRRWTGRWVALFLSGRASIAEGRGTATYWVKCSNPVTATSRGSHCAVVHNLKWRSRRREIYNTAARSVYSFTNAILWRQNSRVTLSEIWPRDTQTRPFVLRKSVRLSARVCFDFLWAHCERVQYHFRSVPLAAKYPLHFVLLVIPSASDIYYIIPSTVKCTVTRKPANYEATVRSATFNFVKKFRVVDNWYVQLFKLLLIHRSSFAYLHCNATACSPVLSRRTRFKLYLIDISGISKERAIKVPAA